MTLSNQRMLPHTAGRSVFCPDISQYSFVGGSHLFFLRKRRSQHVLKRWYGTLLSL